MYVLLIVADQLTWLKKENELLKSENMRFRSIIDSAGLCISMCNIMHIIFCGAHNCQNVAEVSRLVN